MRFWWYDNPPNYGDILTPEILKNFGVDFTFCANRSNAQAMMVGSIAKWAHSGMHIFGSGFIRKGDGVCKSANWHWVRGPLSRQKVLDAGGSCPAIYGDPAFLMPLFWDEAKKKHDVGIVPHHVDYEDVVRDYPNYRVIDLLNPNPEETTRQITECRTIISSSLHGLIAAHAYGIPAAWVKFSDRLHGDGLKFRDHYASIGKDAVLSDMSDPIFSTGSVDIRAIQGILKTCFH